MEMYTSGAAGFLLLQVLSLGSEYRVLARIHILCRQRQQHASAEQGNLGLFGTQPRILLSQRVGVLRASLRLVQRCQVLQRLQVRAESLPLAFGVIPIAEPKFTKNSS